ncbi:M28 family peptidase [Psychroserpens burtonensis]|uniref:M28 family peptidase n=1 Tax=Psychroserpens burtonensis TaxID=49278 RepID=A0A5C7B4X5_9FLAO|nr:M28 family peptidase [Psychroserpens burtonensis]TXE15536.1 M28 family peptidase [Psychroserpens burtonensis]
MKKTLLLIVLIAVFSCKNAPKENVKPITITSGELKETVRFLASDRLLGRNTGSEGIDEAAAYLENQFNALGVKPYFETYRDDFKVDSLEAFNVVGVIEGNDPKLKDEYIIIGAHYDHIGIIEKIVDNDSIANGANDNAAGTSSVIAMAKYFAVKKNNKRSLMFVLFSAEEKGLLGSKHLAKKLKAENINLYTMVNMEMIGVPFKDRDYIAFLTGYGMSNMAEKMNEYLGSKVIGFSEIAKKYNLFRQSDNYAFYEAFKIPCQTISSCDLSNYEYYHHVDDEADKLDYNHMASLINSVIPAIEKMSNTPTKEIKMNEAE